MIRVAGLAFSWMERGPNAIDRGPGKVVWFSSNRKREISPCFPKEESGALVPWTATVERGVSLTGIVTAGPASRISAAGIRGMIRESVMSIRAVVVAILLIFKARFPYTSARLAGNGILFVVG